jgi:ketosteroid isomerase-like protein
MRHRAITAGFCLALLSFWLLPKSHSQGASQDEGRILALENAWNHAEQTKDVKALEQLLSSQLVYVDYDGSTMGKQEFLAQVKSEGLEPDQIVNEQQTAHVFGDCAIVTGIYREKGTNKGKPFSRRGRFTDTWVKFGETWECVASQSTLIQQH